MSTPSPTSTTGLECPAVLPISAQVATVTTASVTIGYSLIGKPPCGYDPPITFTAFGSRADAEQWQRPVAEAVSGPTADGMVTVEGLAADTAYWFRASAAGKHDRYTLETARTAPLTDCPPTLPVYAKVSDFTTSSVTISYTVPAGPPCGYNPPITFTLFRGWEEALAWRNPVAEVVSGPARAGRVTVEGLAAGTTYWFRASVAGTPDPYLLESARTWPEVICVALAPIVMDVLKVQATMVTFRYQFQLSPPCGYDPPITVTLYTSLSNAESGYQPVAKAVSEPTERGEVTVDGLTPGTEYWFRVNTARGPDPFRIGSVRTVPQLGCAATVAIDQRWDGGLIATVTVRNRGSEPMDGWRVAWRWSGDEKIQALWNAAGDLYGADVRIRNATYNAQLAPGGSTTFGMVVATGTSSGSATLTCSD